MNSALGVLGKLAGFAGPLLCIAAVIGRFFDEQTVQGFSASGVINVGIALMVFAILVKLDTPK